MPKTKAKASPKKKSQGEQPQKAPLEEPLDHIDFKEVRFPLKEMFMKFLQHSDSQEHCITDEIRLDFPESPLDSQQSNGTPKQKTEIKLKDIYPTTFVIHETFPLLLLQDATHFASFCLTKELYEKIKEKQISTQYFSEMAQYSLKISKVRLQIRKVNSREVFTSYMGIEIRIIITEGEICESSLKSGMVDSRKNWWMKSLYRDDDVRSLIMSKFHNRMTKWVDQEPEFEGWPESANYFTKDKTVRFDKNSNCLVQQEQEIASETPDGEKNEMVRKKPEEAKDIYFECMKEVYPKDAGYTPFDAEDVLVFEKGQKKYNDMLQNRKDAEEKRNMTKDIFMNASKVFVKNGETPFNTEEERKRTQERQQQRQNRNEIKEMAEQVKIQFFQLQSWEKHFSELAVVSDEKAKQIQLRSRRAANAPVPPRLHLNHTKRYIQWFRENIINDPLVNQNQIEKNKEAIAENFVTKFDHYYDKHDFSLTIIQRTGSISNGYAPQISVASNEPSKNSNNVVKHSAPSQPLTKRVTADVKPDIKPQVPSKDAKKFTIDPRQKKEKVQQEEKKMMQKSQESADDEEPSESAQKEVKEEKTEKEESKGDAPLNNKKAVVGIKRKIGGGISGLGGSLKKQKS